ncbi:endonuclease V [uncultured Enterococcus sp.]|uniref:endonuclease V n=1 Tax=uncultured Enterococcus sp. TaxID=167972 RepID=UPI002AA7B465|nr:endonuclease V [uncultured Enterococcus sp.]
MSELLTQFQQEQEKWQAKISLQTNFALNDIHLVAGVDLAYWQEEEQEFGVCSIVVVDYQTMEVVEEVAYHGKISVPYISGYLAFRELPLVLEAVKKLSVAPDLYMFDGNGYLHIRHMGIATHASFYLKKPTIGVAKNYFTIEGAKFDEPDKKAGSFELIAVKDDVYGLVLRSREDVKPIYVSCGNWIDLETAKEIVLHFVKKDSRLPVPVRYADLATHRKRKECRD